MCSEINSLHGFYKPFQADKEKLQLNDGKEKKIGSGEKCYQTLFSIARNLICINSNKQTKKSNQYAHKTNVIG